MRRQCVRCSLIAIVVLVASARPVAADREEAALAVRPIAGLGRFTESVTSGGGDRVASSYGGGAALELAYGLRNWLDVSGELVGTGFGEVTYDSAMVNVQGIPTAGQLVRARRLAQLRAGAALRLGVGWVPTVYVGLGLHTAMPTPAVLHGSPQSGGRTLTPDGMNATIELDAAVVARVGFERRIDRRWSVGISAEAMRVLGLGGPTVDVISGGITCSYRWYPSVFW